MDLISLGHLADRLLTGEHFHDDLELQLIRRLLDVIYQSVVIQQCLGPTCGSAAAAGRARQLS